MISKEVCYTGMRRW